VTREEARQALERLARGADAARLLERVAAAPPELRDALLERGAESMTATAST
jgi:hypothetical protein